MPSFESILFFRTKFAKFLSPGSISADVNVAKEICGYLLASAGPNVTPKRYGAEIKSFVESLVILRLRRLGFY
jgi:hypothetical protein